ncbi:MAG: hypothetical protein JWP67_2390 [Mucilaginibacter sp.]|nr:hypothetical protein [Mucilaginibacter sp.]
MHSTASTKLAPPENRQGHANGAVIILYSATPDCFPAYCFLLFKRGNGKPCELAEKKGLAAICQLLLHLATLFFGSTEELGISAVKIFAQLSFIRQGMQTGSAKKRKITAEQAVKILREKGFEITVEEARNVLELLYILAKLEVDQYLKE